MQGYALPPSLEEWSQLNDKADELLVTEGQAAYEALYPQIEEAWLSAPVLDRLRVDWHEFKAVWRERITDRKA